MGDNALCVLKQKEKKEKKEKQEKKRRIVLFLLL